MNPRPAYIILLAGSGAWCALILLAPLLADAAPAGGGGEAWSSALYRFFSPVCHQDPARSLFLHGHPLGVCIRCSAIYGAFLAGVIAAPLVRRQAESLSRLLGVRMLWMASAAPMLLDVLCDAAGFHASGLPARLSTGALFGFAAAQLLIPAAVEALRDCAPLFPHMKRRRYVPKTG